MRLSHTVSKIKSNNCKISNPWYLTPMLSVVPLKCYNWCGAEKNYHVVKKLCRFMHSFRDYQYLTDRRTDGDRFAETMSRSAYIACRRVIKTTCHEVHVPVFGN